MRIFISYSRTNADQAAELYKMLDHFGFDPWYDQKLIGGQIWTKELRTEIQKADLLIFLMSEASVNSHFCTLEAQYAYRLKTPILPVLLEAGG
jgi:hypothetical protein